MIVHVELTSISAFITQLFLHAAGLLDEASTPEVDMLSSSRTRIVLSRLAVVVGVLLLVGVLVAVRLFVHIDTKTDWALLCIPANSTSTHPLGADYSTSYPNVTLAPCNDSVTVNLPPTMWSAYVVDNLIY